MHTGGERSLVVFELQSGPYQNKDLCLCVFGVSVPEKGVVFFVGGGFPYLNMQTQIFATSFFCYLVVCTADWGVLASKSLGMVSHPPRSMQVFAGAVSRVLRAG